MKMMSYFVGATHQMCPPSHPYAFLRGTSCCSSGTESTDIATYGEACDGGELSLFSMCCHGNEAACPSGNADCINQGKASTFFIIHSW